MDEKLCPKCHVTKPTSYFYPSKKRPDKLSSYCRECQKADASARQAAKPKRRIKLPTGFKKCPRCGAIKPLAEFGANRAAHDGLQSYCKLCSTIAVTEARHRRPESHRRASKVWREKSEENTHRHYENGVRKRIGNHVEHGTYARLFAGQEGKCAICRGDSPGPRTKRFNMDHCHESGGVRGLLCHNCNHLLGHAFDSPEILDAAKAYLLNFLRRREGAF